MSFIWGTTWIAAKLAVDVVPPNFFGALRFAIVGLVLLPFIGGVAGPFRAGRGWRVVASGLMINTATYGPLFWGMQRIPTGVAALINLSVIVIGLYAMAILTGKESPSWRHAGALGLGLAGLAALFGGDTSLAGPQAVAGAIATIIGTLAYCIGTTLSRPLLDEVSTVALTAVQALVGALGLALASLLLESVSLETLRDQLRPGPLAGLAYMVLGGSLVAYTIYLRLVKAWGAPRAGLYAFTSPVIALVSGYCVFGESLGLREGLGAVLMLAGAGVALWPRPTAYGVKPQNSL